MPEPEEPHYGPWANRIAELLAGTERPFNQESFPELIDDIQRCAREPIKGDRNG
jgi:hypothetical protein